MTKLIAERVYLNPERDADLLAWLSQQKSKSAAIRQALWAYLEHQNNAPPVNAAGVQAIIDPDTIYRAIDEALAERLDLTLIHQVVEAAVSNALAPPAETDHEADTILDTLDSQLVVD